MRRIVGLRHADGLRRIPLGETQPRSNHFKSSAISEKHQSVNASAAHTMKVRFAVTIDITLKLNGNRPQICFEEWVWTIPTVGHCTLLHSNAFRCF